MENLKQIEEDYYKKGSSKNIILSSSTIKYIMPLEGGSPQLFKDVLDQNVEFEESKSLENGKLLHKYIENPDHFKVHSIDKPSEVKGEICMNVISAIENNPDQFQDLLDWYLPVNDNFESEIENKIIATCLASWLEKGYYNNWKDERKVKIIKNELVPFIKRYFLLTRIEEAEVTSKSVKEMLNQGKKNIDNAPWNNIFVLNEEHKKQWEEKGFEIYKELSVYFEWDEIKCKSKLDILKVNKKKKQIIYTDLKTFGKKGIGTYPHSFKYYKTYRQLAFYRKAISEWLKQQGEVYSPQWEIEYQIPVISTVEDSFHLYSEFPDIWFKIGHKEILEAIARVKDINTNYMYEIDKRMKFPQELESIAHGYTE